MSERTGPWLGVQHLGLEGLDEMEVQRRTLRMMARSLNIGRAIAFVGSGTSRAYSYGDFRYPTWPGLLEGAIEKAFPRGTERQSGDKRDVIEQWRRRSGRASRGDAPQRLLTLLGICDEAWRRAHPGGPTFATALADNFKLPQSLPRSREIRDDPLALIIGKLRITRFLTTNYDVEIERALIDVLRCSPESLGFDPETRLPRPDIGTRPGREFASSPQPDHVANIASSLTVDPRRPEFLQQFALGVPGFEAGVFHCHGIAYRPESMVVTEADYQRVYLKDDPLHRAYRNALDLAINANSVFFIGAGLGEDDLLRPLRQFLAEGQQGASERPLFAILGYPGDAAELRAGELNSHSIELRTELYARYGVKVWFFADEGWGLEADDPNKSARLTESLCLGIREVATTWTNWWDAWQRKPPIRRPTFNRADQESCKVMVHHGPPIDGGSKDPFEATADVDRVKQELKQGDSVVVLGRAGSGKGNLGVLLAKDPVQSSLPYASRFFGTMHFTNELLSTVEAAADFFEEINGTTPEGGKDHFDRLRDALANGSHLLVIGGIERLLVSAGPTELLRAGEAPDGDYPIEVGRPVSREVQRLLDLASLQTPRSKSKVVFTSSIEPLGRASFPDHPKYVHLHGPTLDAVLGKLVRNDAIKKLLAILHEALHRHTYTLGVLIELLKRSRGESLTDSESLRVRDAEDETWLSELVRRVTTVDLSQRAGLAIEAAIAQLCRQQCSDAPTSGRPSKAQVMGTLQRFALFPTPVRTAELLAAWYGKAPPDESVSRVGEAVRVLVECHLLLEVDHVTNEEQQRYTAHTVVRQHVLNRLGRRIGEIASELNRLSLTAFSVESAVPTVPPPQTPAGHAFVARCVDNLLDHLEEVTDADAGLGRHGVRAAYGIIRSRWNVTSVPQHLNVDLGTIDGHDLTHFQAYQRRLLRLANAIRTAEESRLWFSVVSSKPEDVSNADGYLYADELAWLYNELGMVSYSRGMVHDAYALFRIGQDVNAVAERGARETRWCQSEINLAGVHIEAANLSRARYHLENALRRSRAREDDAMLARVLGYLGLVHHLSGGYHDAELLYRQAVARLRRQGNRRGLSIFLRHRSDLRRKQGRLDDADHDVRASLAAAESGGHLELVQYGRVAEANCGLARGVVGSHEVLMPAVEFARRVGIPKLEADALKVQGQIALRNGETELAGRLAMGSLAIAVSGGMRLRVTSNLVLMGRVAQTRGDWRSAEAMFRSAIELGHFQGYQLQVEQADRELSQVAAKTRRFEGR